MRTLTFLRRLWGRRRAKDELDEEVQAYFEIQIERTMARGLSREEARRAVWIRWENPLRVKEHVREARVGTHIETALNDIRYAGRTLGRNRGFTAFAVLTIAVALQRRRNRQTG